MTNKWLTYFMGLAKLTANMSKDTTKVGALLVGENKEILITSFNGPPIGVKDTPERFERPAKYLFASHAEQNIIALAARNGIKTEGKTIVCTHSPCSACAKSLIQAGIKTVVIGDGTTSMPDEEFTAAYEMFSETDMELIYAD